MSIDHNDPRYSEPTGDHVELKMREYAVSKFNEYSVWIQSDTGEGGQFDLDVFEAAVKKFYLEHF